MDRIYASCVNNIYGIFFGQRRKITKENIDSIEHEMREKLTYFRACFEASKMRKSNKPLGAWKIQ